jgi:hypothetical protein
VHAHRNGKIRGSDSFGRNLEVTRRAVLAGSVGAAILIAVPLPAEAEAAAARRQTGEPGAGLGSGTPRAFLYGIVQGSDPGPSLHAARSSARASALRSTAIAANLASLPVRSPDQSTLAATTVTESSGGMTVTVSLLDTVSAAQVGSGNLTLPGLPRGTLLLARPVFTAGNRTLALVLSVTVPSEQHTVSKHDLDGRQVITGTAATWTSHHELAYFDGRTGTFAGPFDLADAPSLARTTAISDGRDLFLWTVDEAAAVMPDKAGAAATPGSRPVTRLAAYPLGSGQPRYSVPTPGPWPVNGEPVILLSGSRFARLAYARQVEVYSAPTGHAVEIAPPALQRSAAKPATPSMQALASGLVLINKPSIGRAVIADPSRSFRAVTLIDYPRPQFPERAPAALSADQKTLYVLGGAGTGGISAYDIATGALTASRAAGTHYTGLYQLSGGLLLALKPTAPKLVFFTPDLEPYGTANTDLYVSAVV